jgi:hypothetical protein
MVELQTALHCIKNVLESFIMNYPAASYGVSKTPRNEASFGEYDPERFKYIEIGY